MKNQGYTIFLTGLFCFIFSNLYSQNYAVSGTVLDEQGNPLIGCSICQIGTNNCTISDFDGDFALSIKTTSEQSIDIKYIGYLTKVISNIDTITKPILIKMNLDSLSLHYMDDDLILTHQTRHRQFGFISSFGIDVIPTDFSEFESLLQNYNTDFMSQGLGVLNFELAGTYKHIYLGIGFGFLFNDDYDNDSLSVRLNTTQFGLNFGYSLINSKRFSITPKVGLRWKHFRQLNSDISRKIPIEKYLEEGNLDIRFNQTYAVGYVDFSYKFHLFDKMSSDFWSIGAYAGYVLPLNKVPWTYSEGNRLLTDNQILIGDLYWGFYFAFNIG